MTKKKSLTPDMTARICLDYIYFDDSVQEIAENYKTSTDHLCRQIRKGIALGFATQKQYNEAKSRRNRELNLGRTFSEETKKKLSKSKRSLSDDETAALCYDYVYFNDSRGEIAKNYGVSNKTIFRLMNRGIDLGFINQEQYDEAIRRNRKALSGENSPNYGRIFSEKHRKKLSEAKKGENHPNYGRTLPGETRRKLSEALSGENNPNYGKSCSEKTRKRMSKALSGENNPNYGKTPSEKTKRKLSEASKSNGSGIKTIELLRKQAYHIEDRFYTLSQQEGAAALMLEKYVPCWKLEENKTFQVRDRGISNGGIDFLVDGEFLEWHPMVLYHGTRGDIPSQEEAKAVKGILNYLSKTDPDSRKWYEQFYKGELAKDYLSSRQSAIDNSGYAGTNVALAADIKELYGFIERHASALPSYAAFQKEFRDAVKYVKSFAVKKEMKREVA
jgi:predicted DNA-binding protein YlxM (UPF0122 family)